MNVFLRSLNWKLKIAKYHYDKALAAQGSDPFALYLLGDKAVVDVALIECDAEFTGMMLTLHSCLEMLAQWINSLTLHRPIDKVTFKSITEALASSSIGDYLLTLRNSTIYLSDFVNTTKHRRLVCVDQEQSEATGCVMEYFYIHGFEYEGRCYKDKYLADILKETYFSVTKQIALIIKEVESL